MAHRFILDGKVAYLDLQFDFLLLHFGELHTQLFHEVLQLGQPRPALTSV